MIRNQLFPLSYIHNVLYSNLLGLAPLILCHAYASQMGKETGKLWDQLAVPWVRKVHVIEGGVCDAKLMALSPLSSIKTENVWV